MLNISSIKAEKSLDKTINTARLILRQWQDKDIAPLTAINQDPKFFEFIASPLKNSEEAKDFINRANIYFKEHGFGWWAVEIKKSQELVGFVGLRKIDYDLSFCPTIEIGWRLGSKYWGYGYATEAAKKVLEIGYTNFNLPEIVSFTIPYNIKSIKVMERLGMHRDLHGDFYHTALPKDHPMALHILYRLSRQEYLALQ